MKKDTIYTALDGKTFNNKEECLEYEFENCITQDDLIFYLEKEPLEKVKTFKDINYSDLFEIKSERGLTFANILFPKYANTPRFKNLGIYSYGILFDEWVELKEFVEDKEKELDELKNIIKLITEQE